MFITEDFLKVIRMSEKTLIKYIIIRNFGIFQNYNNQKSFKNI